MIHQIYQAANQSRIDGCAPRLITISLCYVCRRHGAPAEGVMNYSARALTTTGPAHIAPPATEPPLHILLGSTRRPWRARDVYATPWCVPRTAMEVLVAGASNTTFAPSHLGPPQSRIPLTHHPRATAGSPRWSQGDAMVIRAMPTWAPPSKRDHMHHGQGMSIVTCGRSVGRRTQNSSQIHTLFRFPQ